MERMDDGEEILKPAGESSSLRGEARAGSKFAIRLDRVLVVATRAEGRSPSDRGK
jgi:hypothetical protein